MKKLLYIFSILGISLILLNSCREDDKTLFSYGDDIVEGAIVVFDVNPPIILGVNTLDEVQIGGELYDPIGNVAEYTLTISAVLGGAATETFTVGTYTSFPVNLNLTLQDLATLLGVTTGDIGYGDQFFFEGTVTDDQGRVYSASAPEIDDDGNWVMNGNTDIEVYNPGNGYKDGLLFDVTIGCPADSYDSSNIAGVYNVASGWSGPGTVTISVDSSDPNTLYVDGIVEIEGMVSHTPMTWHVDPATNAVTLDPVVITDNYFGYAGFFYRGGGTLFPCAGNKFVMNLDPQILNLGGWGPQGFEFTPQ